MRKLTTLVFVISFTYLSSQTLSPTAQALYTTMFNSDLTRGNYAITNGATFHSSPDSLSFYLQWFPNGSTQPDTLPVIVTCHGSTGKVFDEFYLWHPYAVANNCGIIAVQWFNPDSSVWYNDHYLKDTAIYNTIELGLSSINYPSGKALFHGFSRGAARSYAINLYDILSGNNYFCTTISNSGSAEPAYPLYHDIDLGIYGSTPFLGRRWALYCGELDPNPSLSGCVGMTNTQNWLTAKGAVVEVFIQDPSGTHGGFHMNSSNVDSIMAYYLGCFNTTVGVATVTEDHILVYPNPSEGNIFIKIPSSFFKENSHFELYDGLGRLSFKRPLKESLVRLDGLPKGNYFYLIKNRENIISKGKLVVE